MKPGDTVEFTLETTICGDALKGTRGKVMQIASNGLIVVRPESPHLRETAYQSDAWRKINQVPA